MTETMPSGNSVPAEIRTRVTELFGIRYPIIQGGMIWAAGARLAVAVSRAGGLGLIGSGSMYPDELVQQIRWAKSQTEAPVGVNIPLLRSDAEELVELCIREEVPVVFTSAGSPKKFTRRLQEAGIKVAHVVPSVPLARKCEEAGVDAIVAEGTEAGGHNGYEEITTMCLVPQVVDAVAVPVIAAGGIADGRGMAAALALGAEGVQMGTRFALSEESDAHPAFKQAGIRASNGATRLIARRYAPVRVILNAFAKRILEAEEKGATAEEIAALIGKGRARLGIREGDLEEGELEIGQITGLIREVKPAGDIVREVVAQFVREAHHLSRLADGTL